MSMNLDLLVELIRVLHRYSKEDWRNVAEALRDDSTRGQLIELAELLSMPKRQRKLSSATQVGERNIRFRPLLAVGSSDEEKLKRLKELQTGIYSRKIFPSTKELREFASSLGLKLSPKYDRERIAHELIKRLADLPANEIESKILKHQVGQRDYGREYENWVKLILGPTAKNGIKGEKNSSDSTV
jgi:hypothetical protein